MLLKLFYAIIILSLFLVIYKTYDSGEISTITVKTGEEICSQFNGLTKTRYKTVFGGTDIYFECSDKSINRFNCPPENNGVANSKCKKVSVEYP